MASRDIHDLDKATRIKAERFIVLCDENDFDVLIYCTLRSPEDQSILYRQSRSLSIIKNKARELSDTHGRSDLAQILMSVGPQSGPHVTQAAPGQSLHNYGMAFDGVPMRGGKPVWGSRASDDLSLWRQYGELASMVGLEWAGNWTNFVEFPHCQQKNERWQDLIQTVRAA